MQALERLKGLLGDASVDIVHAGATERPLVRAAPAEPEQWRDVMRLAAEERWTLCPIGHGTRAQTDGADVLLSTHRWSGVLAYEPGDGTITARSGSSMQALYDEVAAGGHRLAPTVARPDATTLGSVLATGRSGFDRLRFGPARDGVLGLRLLLADGTLVKSGGALVKNVTGYDLHRLFCGSHGTLGVLLEASLRLAPGPDSTAIVECVGLDADAALALAREVRALPLRPLAILVEADFEPGSPHRTETCVRVVCAGRADVVAWELEQLGALGLLPAPVSLDDVRDAEESPAAVALELQARPARIAELWRTSASAIDAARLRARARCHPGLGLLRWTLADGQLDAARLDAHLAAELPYARRSWRWASTGAPCSAPAAPRDLGSRPAPAPAALMIRLKQAFDPDGRFGAPTLEPLFAG